MAEILRSPSFGQAAVRLPGPSEVDRTTSDVIAAAYEQGRADGWRDGERAGRAAATDFAGAVEHALAGYAQACAATRAELSDHLVELAEALVEGVLGHRPDTATLGMLDRLRGALEMIEDGPLTVVVHPSTLEMMQPALAMRAGGHPLECRDDARLAPGEVVVEGPWAFAELTWPRLLDAARLALRELRDTGDSLDSGAEPLAVTPGGAE